MEKKLFYVLNVNVGGEYHDDKAFETSIFLDEKKKKKLIFFFAFNSYYSIIMDLFSNFAGKNMCAEGRPDRVVELTASTDAILSFMP